MSNPPIRKSKLEPYANEIFSLRNDGVSEQKIVEFLALKKGVKVSQQTLNYFIKKSDQEQRTAVPAQTELEKAKRKYEEKAALLDDKFKNVIAQYKKIALEVFKRKPYSLPSDDVDTLWLIYYCKMASRMKGGIFHTHSSSSYLLCLQQLLNLMREDYAAEYMAKINAETVSQQVNTDIEEESDINIQDGGVAENSISLVKTEEDITVILQ